ncbi:MAG: insulinase family protein [Clostridia bacterium]|nr:insulinase family protein [Clostridia bacterium]
MINLINYPNGLRLVVQNNPFVRSVAASIWVKTGSAMETPSNNGISHFVEHVLFKGTDKMSAFEIANAFERRGASVNAFTSKETTCFYYKSIDEDAEACFEILSDLFFNSVFDENELNSERNVILEEINMEDDSPEDICYDLLAKCMYGDHPFGMTVLGSSENVKRIAKADVKEYISAQYTAPSIVIAIVGNIDAEKADNMVRKYFLPYVKSEKPKAIATAPTVNVKSDSIIKDFKQTNLMLGYPSLSLKDENFASQAVLNLTLGGCMGSRLFQNIREKKGLAYSVYSSPTRASVCGTFNIVLNINAKNTARALDGVYEEIDSLLRSGITEGELQTAKAQLKSGLIFGQENLQTVMLALGKALLLSDEVYDIDKKVIEIDQVSVESVNEMAKSIFTQSPALAYVGVDSGIDLDKYSRR